MMPVLAVRGLTLAIADAPIVRGLDLAIAPGEVFALVGESGCGKSLTALALMRLLPPAVRQLGGEVIFAGQDLCRLPEAKMRGFRGRRLAMIFQEPGSCLNPVLTIGEQLAEALRLAGEEPRAERLAALLAEVGMPDPKRRLTEYPFQLSGGMKQRVMIAMALAGNPDLLIADEPTTALDVTIQSQVLELLLRLRRERGMALLLITHDFGVVAQIADRVAVMYAGEIVELASRAAFFAGPRHPYAQRLLAAVPEISRRGDSLASIPGQPPAAGEMPSGCRFAPRCEYAQKLCRQQAPKALEANGHRVRCHFPLSSMAPRLTAKEKAGRRVAARPLLEVEDLAVHFPIRRGILRRTVGHVRAVDGLCLNLSSGRTLALVGESGCGKTTAGKAILGLLPPTRGAIRLAGRLQHGLAPRLMQMVFQDPFASLDPRRRIGESIAEGNPAADVGELLRRVGLAAAMADRYPHEFSGGQRQRIAIARALAMQPQLLILDEPTSALDVSVQAQILNLFCELQRDLGLAYLFISHNLGAVAHLADDVAVMYLGRVVEEGPAAAVLAEPAHPYTQALLAAVPRLDGQGLRRLDIPGDPPSPAQPPPGCHFAPRCPAAMAICRERYPPIVVITARRRVACWLAAEG